MNGNRTSMRFRVIIFSLTAAAIAFAIIHSLMPSDVSSAESGGLLDILNYILRSLGIGLEISEHLLRKLAHFSEYAVIGALLLSCAYSFDRIRPHRFAVYVLFSGLMIAVADETVQLNVEGRAGMITDVWIDFSGVIIGAAVMWTAFAIYRKIRRRYTEK